MVAYKKFSAWIEIEGQRAAEYGIETKRDEDGVKVVSCWIPSEAGKTFEIVWRDDRAKTATSGKVTVDGRPTFNSGIISRRNKGRKASSKGFAADADTYRCFRFANIVLTDDDAFLQRSVDADLGSIVLQITRVEPKRKDKSRKFEGKSWKYNIIPEQEIHHERSKKAMQHHVSAGAAFPHKGKSYSVEYLGGPVVKFVFRYRPIDMLMAKDIAPRPTASALREPTQVEEEAEVDARIEQLEFQLAAARAQKKRKDPFVKIEEFRPLIPVPVQIIDLTLESPRPSKRPKLLHQVPGLL